MSLKDKIPGTLAEWQNAASEIYIIYTVYAKISEEKYHKGIENFRRNRRKRRMRRSLTKESEVMGNKRNIVSNVALSPESRKRS